MQQLLVVLNCTTSFTDANLPINFDYFSDLFGDPSYVKYETQSSISQLRYLLLAPSSQFWYVLATAQYFSEAITVPKADDFVFKYQQKFQYVAVVYADYALQVRRLLGLVETIFKQQRECYDAGVRIVRLTDCTTYETFSSILYKEDCMPLDAVAEPAKMYSKPSFITSSTRYLHPNDRAAALVAPLKSAQKRFAGACQIIQAWHELGYAHCAVPRLIGLATLNSTAQRCGAYLQMKNANPSLPSHTCTLFSQNGSLAWTSEQAFASGAASDIIAAMEALSHQKCAHLYYISTADDQDRPLHHLIAYILGIRVFDAELAEFAREEDILSQERTLAEYLIEEF